MKIKAWDMELPCSVSFRLIKVKLKDKWLVLATKFLRLSLKIESNFWFGVVQSS